MQHTSSLPTKLVIASHNQGKVREIGALLEPLGISVICASELNLPEPEENGTSFVENAHIKSLAAATASGLPALADDSGLSVDCLNGAPGIYSARWAGPTKDFTLAIQKIQQEITATGHTATGAKAAFICVLSLCWPDGHEHHFEGRVDGRLSFPPRGLQGFGYDPIFKAEGNQRTFAEISPEEKHAISHRADAFCKLMNWMQQKESA